MLKNITQSDTNAFTEQINSFFQEYVDEPIDPDQDDDIFTHQRVVIEYMRYLNKIPEEDIKQRGVLLYHGVGSGKTRSALLMMEQCLWYDAIADKDRKYSRERSTRDPIQRSTVMKHTKGAYRRKVIFLTPAGLVLDPWIDEIQKTCEDYCELKDEVLDIRQDRGGSLPNVKLLKEYLFDIGYYFVSANAYGPGGRLQQLAMIPNRATHPMQFLPSVSDRNNPFDDSVIIIDEVHNLVRGISNDIIRLKREPEIYLKLFNARNARVIALSATPIINKPFEIGIMANLIRGRISRRYDLRFSTDPDVFNKNFFNLSGGGDKLINADMLRRRLYGICSHYHSVRSDWFALKTIDYVRVLIRGNQLKGYLFAMQKEENIKKKMKNKTDKDKGKRKRRNVNVNVGDLEEKDDEIFLLYGIKASNAVFPPYMFEGTKFEKEYDKSFLLTEKITLEKEKGIMHQIDKHGYRALNIAKDLVNVSKKLFHVVYRVIRCNGPCLIYSRFRGIYGIELIACALRHNGFEPHKLGCGEGGPPKYMLWTGAKRESNIAQKDLFNHDRNKHGGIIKVILMTQTGKEGINLRGVRQIHLFEPWWHRVLDEQIIGRGIRIRSHDHVPVANFVDMQINENRRMTGVKMVNVFHYMAYAPNDTVSDSDPLNYRRMLEIGSKDHMVYRIAEKKEIRKKQILLALKSVAIDCDAHKYRNINAVACFTQTIYDNIFAAWSKKDPMNSADEMTGLRIIETDPYNGTYLIDAGGFCYRPKNPPIVLSDTMAKRDLIVFGKIGPTGTVVRINESVYTNMLNYVNKTIMVQDMFSYFYMHVLGQDPRTCDILDLTTINEVTAILPKVFKTVYIILPSMDHDDDLARKISARLDEINEPNVHSFLSTKKQIDVYLESPGEMEYSAINIDPAIILHLDTIKNMADIANRLHKHSRFVFIQSGVLFTIRHDPNHLKELKEGRIVPASLEDTRGDIRAGLYGTLELKYLLNQSIYNADTKMLCIKNKIPRNGISKFLQKHCEFFKDLSSVFKGFVDAGIFTLAPIIALCESDLSSFGTDDLVRSRFATRVDAEYGIKIRLIY